MYAQQPSGARDLNDVLNLFSIFCVCEQGRFCRDCASESLGYSQMRLSPQSDTDALRIAKLWQNTAIPHIDFQTSTTTVMVNPR